MSGATLWHAGSLPISCDDPCHRRRGSAGGEDFAVGVGRPVFAPFSGTFRFRVAGTGGWTLTGISSEVRGAVSEGMHLSRAILPLGGSARYVTKGTLLGFSGGRRGAPGAGSSTGPHIHEHGILNGVRMGMRAFVTKYNAKVAAAARANATKREKARVFHWFIDDKAVPEGLGKRVLFDGSTLTPLTSDESAELRKAPGLAIASVSLKIYRAAQSVHARNHPPVTAGGAIDAVALAAAVAAAVDAKVAPRFSPLTAIAAGVAKLAAVFK